MSGGNVTLITGSKCLSSQAEGRERAIFSARRSQKKVEIISGIVYITEPYFFIAIYETFRSFQRGWTYVVGGIAKISYM